MRRSRKNQMFYVALDILACALAMSVTFALLWGVKGLTLFALNKMNLAWFVLEAMLVIIWGFCFQNYRSYSRNIEFEDALRQAAIVMITAIVFFLMKVIHIQGEPIIRTSSQFMAINFALLAILMIGFRSVGRILHCLRLSWAQHQDFAKRAVIVGAGHAGTMVAKRLRENNEEDVFPVAFVDDDPQKQGGLFARVRVYGTVDDLEDVIQKVHANQIIIATPSAQKEQMDRIISICARTVLPVKVFQNMVDVDEFSKRGTKALHDIPMEDLLFRDTVPLDTDGVEEYIRGKVVLVTGGAGSIGSELCRQCLQNSCAKLVIFDISENGLFEIDRELREHYHGRYEVRLGTIRDAQRLAQVFDEFRPDIVFHAAAHKHVPMMEGNPLEAVKNNVFGTRNLLLQCVQHKTSRFIMISTDKAVRPTNIMGATKRVCEMMTQEMNGMGGCQMSAVRFGNVLGSNGSVIPTFKRQIAVGGPVTVTHRDIERYFMTIPEAVGLVLCTGVRARGGEIFVLNMNKPIKIYDLAYNMIRLAGLEPNKDIQIEITGLRPGEKLYEELSLDYEQIEKTEHSKIFVVKQTNVERAGLNYMLEELERALHKEPDIEQVRKQVFQIIAEKETIQSPQSGKIHSLVHAR